MHHHTHTPKCTLRNAHTIASTHLTKSCSGYGVLFGVQVIIVVIIIIIIICLASNTYYLPILHMLA